jgi:hypothetical protein
MTTTTTIASFVDTLKRFHVEIERETAVDEKSTRAWVGILNTENVEMVKRRSIILCLGFNQISLYWKPNLLSNGRASVAALYASANAKNPRYECSINENINVQIEDSVILTWTITHWGGEL